MESVVPAQLIQTGHLCTAGPEGRQGTRASVGFQEAPGHWPVEVTIPISAPTSTASSLDLSWDFFALSNWNHDVDPELKATILLPSHGAAWQTWSSEGAESSCA